MVIDLVYLDNASTTAIDEDVLDAMKPYLTSSFGNPGTKYSLGREARDAIENARENVAAFLGVSSSNVIFTSGGTESNNIAILSACEAAIAKNNGRNKIVSCVGEHDSVIKTIMYASEKYGFEYTLVGLDESGRINYDELIGAIDDNTALVSVMHTNNETGVVNYVRTVSLACQEHGAPLHIDMVQSAYDVMSVDIANLWCDYVSISSHKLHAPKGVGALYIKNIDDAESFIHGGDRQERGIRSGTENVAGIVGFGKACSMIIEHEAEYRDATIKAKDAFLNSFIKEILSQQDTFYRSGIDIGNMFTINSNSGRIVNMAVHGIDSESLLLALDASDVCVSSGAACSELSYTPSRVLLAMGMSEEMAKSSIRISFSWKNTVKECERAGFVFANVVTQMLLTKGKMNGQ